MRYNRETQLHALVRKLEGQTRVPLGPLLDYRNSAVHDIRPPISKDHARKLVTGVQELSDE